MVFSLFARKPDSSQLLTPSPSDSPAALSPTPPPTTETEPEPEPEPEVTDSTALYDLVRSVPPQTLHAYTLAHLCPPSESGVPSSRTLTALTHFFHELSPPPQLHCARCHSSFFELSNTDTSCRIPHDDESALVDRAAYETLWGCCGRTVEGTGDIGPPDGWCYEGRHTTDTRRARFRADSTIHDDKIVSCAARGCYGRKRKRSVSVSSGDLSASIRKKDKAKANAKANVEASPSSARKPASKSSSPKPLSKSGTFISSVTLVHPRIRPLPKSNLHQSHVALPTVDAVSESGSDAQPHESDIPARPTRDRTRKRTTVDETKNGLTADDKTRSLADENICKPRTRSAVREERSLSRTRMVVRGSSVRVLREREKEKEMIESDGDDRGRARGREVKKRRVGV